MSRLLVVLLIFPAVAMAAPAITDVGGTFAPDSLLTITGASFGSKSPAAPHRYLNFEDGTVGNYITDQAGGGIWTIGTSWSKPTYSQAYQRITNETVMLQNHANYVESGGGSNNAAFGLYGVDLSTMYFCGWSYRHDVYGNAERSTQQKLFGNFSTLNGPCDNVYPNLRADSEWGSYPAGTGTGSVRLYGKDHPVDNCEAYTANLSPAYLGHSASLQLGNWFRMSRYVDGGTPSGGDGTSFIRVHTDGGLATQATQSGTLYQQNTTPYQKFQIGHYFTPLNSVTGAVDVGLKVYWSEVYFDTTPARVEMGNRAVYEDCTHIEIQIPVTWGTGAITATCNTGTFQVGDTVYVYVFDSNNAISSADGPYTINASYDIPDIPEATTITRPDNLQVVE